MASKTCSRCGENQPRSEFHRRTASLDGISPWCKTCVRDYDSNRGERRRARKRELDYGLTAEAFQALYDQQRGRCAACSDPLVTERRGLHVDHCHRTGKVRGLLCRNCNLALGYLKDSPARISGLLAFIEAQRG